MTWLCSFTCYVQIPNITCAKMFEESIANNGCYGYLKVEFNFCFRCC